MSTLGLRSLVTPLNRNGLGNPSPTQVPTGGGRVGEVNRIYANKSSKTQNTEEGDKINIYFQGLRLRILGTSE